MPHHVCGGPWLRHVVIVAFNVFYWLPIRGESPRRDIATLEVDHDPA
jgi:hypothetical protein